MGLPFLKSSVKKRDQIVAIDLGNRTTKAVHLQRKGSGFSLVNYAVIETPANEKSISADGLAELLKNVSRELGNPRTKQVTLALGVNETTFRQVELPVMNAEDMRQMVKFNSKNYLQQDLPDHVFDCFVLPVRELPKPAEPGKPAGGVLKQKVAVGGTKKQILDDVQAAIKTAGLVPDQVVLGVVCPVNAFEMAEPEAFAKEVVALVDIGFKYTTITLLDGGELVLNRVVALGGDRITSGLAEAMGISYSEAEGIKVGTSQEIQGNLEAVINPLGRELRASLDFFEHQHDKPVSQVFISGGSARNEHIVVSLQNELMVPCKSWNPTRFLQLALPPEKMGEIEQIAPQLTVAVGAAASAF